MCGRRFKTRSGEWKHKKNCEYWINYKNEGVSKNVSNVSKNAENVSKNAKNVSKSDILINLDDNLEAKKRITATNDNLYVMNKQKKF